VPEDRGPARRHHHADELRQAGQQVGGVGNHLLRLLGSERMRRDVLALHRQHGIDEQSVALGGGNAPGRGMWAGNEAQILQVRHDIADRRGREFQPARARERARTYGLPVLYVALYQRFEQQLGACIQHAIILVM